MWGKRWSVIRSTDFILILEQNYKGSILEEAKRARLGLWVKIPLP